MKQALKQSFSLALKTAFPTGIIASLIVYLLRWLVFYDSINTFSEEASLFLLIVVACCCITYTVIAWYVLFLNKTTYHVSNTARRNK